VTGQVGGIFALVVFPVVLVVSIIRLHRNQWKDRQTGGLHSDYTNAVVAIIGIAAGLLMLLT
jgi:hypothetical protein